MAEQGGDLAEGDVEAAVHLRHHDIRHFPVKGVGDAAGDAGLGIAVAAQGHRFADRVLVTFRFQKRGDSLRHRPGAGGVIPVIGPDGGEALAQIVLKLRFNELSNLVHRRCEIALKAVVPSFERALSARLNPGF